MQCTHATPRHASPRAQPSHHKHQAIRANWCSARFGIGSSGIRRVEL